MIPLTISVEEMFERGANALDSALVPGRVAHLTIDWQRLYCDPQFPVNRNDNLQLAGRILATLEQVNQFNANIRHITPTWWVHHDPEISVDDFPDNFFARIEQQDIRESPQAFRAEDHEMGDDVHRIRPKFHQQFGNIFDSVGSSRIGAVNSTFTITSSHPRNDPHIPWHRFPDKFPQDLKRNDIDAYVQAFRIAGQHICGNVHRDDVTFRKPFKDAFEGTNLDERLRVRDIDTVLISGLYRFYNECVGKTAAKAAELGYNAFIVEDLTVDHVQPTDQSRQSLYWMTNRDGAYCVTSAIVRTAAAKFRP